MKLNVGRRALATSPQGARVVVVVASAPKGGKVLVKFDSNGSASYFLGCEPSKVRSLELLVEVNRLSPA